MQWIKHPGYDESWKYVDVNGRIAGIVSGSTFQPHEGWFARITNPDEEKRLGRYMEREQAQAAVEEHYAAQIEDARAKRTI